MQRYRKTITVQKDDLDELNHVNNVRYVQWMQDISKEHWMTVAPEEMRRGIIWVVMTHHITYKNAAVLGDVIEMETYIQKSRGAVSVRIVEMHNKKTGELLLKSSTEWCLLNADTLKPARISKEIKEVFSPESN
ncbi:thioesterase family protein [Zobellia galactanivorans]|uniref:acyl-CoA thioesterase n=1 Tax=Zobellia TaxID=112040 RepID=UPI000B52F458|nr:MULTISPECIES: thioesterase family protein [Zobellia]MBU3027052.1 acyl-CoA thioesterase [Zobellia galactanivorans]MDO6517035.1 thioesterase family protein [Zobellia uliginosa]MDO6808018.1 thioesterase family protein [Zobellia galactanivorans]OWW24913.1 thioesterase [Zobellia sp. OII3]